LSTLLAKSISETFSSANKNEINIPEVDKSVIDLSIKNHKVEDIKKLREKIKAWNLKLRKMKSSRSMWVFFGSLIFIIVLVLDFHFRHLFFGCSSLLCWGSWFDK